MVNFRDPAVIQQDLLTITKFWHALSGLYIWEFFTTLDFEWDVIRGRRPYRWTIWIYSLTRLAMLLAVIFVMIGIDVTTPYNCYDTQAATVIQMTFGYMAITAASLLIVLRSIAIWNRNKLVIAIVTSVWVVNVGILIRSVARIRASWVPLLTTCTTSDIHDTKLNIITILINDVTLLLIMLIGLLRLGFHEPGVCGLGRLMWKQGLIWLFLATLAEIPPVVFISLDLNDPLDYMFLLPAVMTMSIAATRIYRSLVDFSSNVTDSSSGCRNFHSSGSSIAASKGNRGPAKAISLESMEVAAHRTSDQSQTTMTTSPSQQVVFISLEGAMHENPAGLGPDYDLERGAES